MRTNPTQQQLVDQLAKPLATDPQPKGENAIRMALDAEALARLDVLQGIERHLAQLVWIARNYTNIEPPENP